MSRRVFEVRGRLTEPDGGPAGGVLVALVDADPDLDDLLGAGTTSPDGSFRLSFTEEAFNQERGEAERVPDLYLVASRLTDRGPVPALRKSFPGLAFESAEDLGDVRLPAQGARVGLSSRGVSSMPGAGRWVRRLEVDEAIVDHAAREVAPLVEALTGFTDLLKGVRFAVHEDVTEGLRAHVSGLLGRELGAELLADVAADFIALWDAPTRHVHLSRAALERQNLDFLKVVIGHELVHVGQSQLVEGEREHRAMARAGWEAHLAGESARVTSEMWRFMANLEGYAHYIEHHFLRRIYTHADQLPDPAAAAAGRLARRRRAERVDLAFEALRAQLNAPNAVRRRTPPPVLGTKSSQYLAGSALYAARGEGARPARFDPSARPEELLDPEVLAVLIARAGEGCATSQHLLGVAFVHGRGVPAEPAVGKAMLTAAAEGGIADAGVIASSLCAEDDPERVRLLRLAAGAGQVRAMELLIDAYMGGRGVAVDERAALEWTKLAAEAGSTVAMKILVEVYRRGAGVPQDLASARLWEIRLAKAAR